MDSLPEPSDLVEDEWAAMKIRFKKEGLNWDKLGQDERILQVMPVISRVTGPAVNCYRVGSISANCQLNCVLIVLSQVPGSRLQIGLISCQLCLSGGSGNPRRSHRDCLLGVWFRKQPHHRELIFDLGIDPLKW